MATFDLIVSTRNRAVQLRRLLDSLESQTFKAFRLIVVDQSDDEEAELVRQLLAARAELHVEYVRTSTRGLSRGRNIGLDIADACFIAFPDDDCWYPEGLLERVEHYFRSFPATDVVLGQYTEPGVVNPMFPQAARVRGVWLRHPPVASVSMFWRSAAIEGAMFDEGLGAGTDMPIGEETLFFWQAKLMGVRSAYLPEVVVWHSIAASRPPTWRRAPEIQRAHGYVIGRLSCLRGKYLAKHWLGLLKLVLTMGPTWTCLKLLRARCAGFNFGRGIGRLSGRA